MILQCSTLNSTSQQPAHRGWHGVNRPEEFLMEEGEEVGDGRAEGSSAIGDGGQAVVSLMLDIDGMHICIFESSKLEGSYVGDLL